MLIASHDPTTILEAQHRIRALDFDTTPDELDRLLDLVPIYRALTDAVGLHFTWTVAQAILESDYARSPLARTDNNFAGIKPGPHGGPDRYRSYLTPALGVEDHVRLLALYAGIRVPQPEDPTRLTRIPYIITSALGRPFVVFSYELNGIWATPGDRYGQNIDSVWRSVFGPHFA